MCLEYFVYIIYIIFLLFQFLSFVFNESNITTWMKDEVIESTLSGKIFPLSLIKTGDFVLLIKKF